MGQLGTMDGWIERGAIEEANSRPVRCTLTRSGDRTAAETFAVQSTADSRVTIPSQITFSAGQSSTNFYIQIVDNDILDDTGILDITVSGIQG